MHHQNRQRARSRQNVAATLSRRFLCWTGIAALLLAPVLHLMTGLDASLDYDGTWGARDTLHTVRAGVEWQL